MPHTVDVGSPHVPAWKRLGLKLKNAKEEDNAVPDVHKRKRELEERDNAHVKRSKSADTSQTSSVALVADVRRTKKGRKSDALDSSQDITVKSPQHVQTPTLSRLKSVTFTSDTKADDGESTKQLINSWVTDQKARDPDFDTRSAIAYSVPEAAKVSVDVDPTLPEPERRVQRVKTREKAGKKGAKKLPDKSPKLDGALSYLDAFCNAKDRWRFNKKHQTTLLKNVFSLRLIPSDHIEGLYVYVTGLQGLARKTLRDSALAVKVKDMEESREAKDAAAQARYDAALKEYVAAVTANNAHPAMGYEEGILLGLSDFAMKERVAKRIRAERLINEIVQANASEDATSQVEPTNGSATADGEGGNAEESSNKRVKLENGKTARRRKQRTQEVVEDSSSSESSSGSGSDNEDSDSDEEEDESGDEDDAEKEEEEEDDETSSSESSTSSDGDSNSGESEDSGEDSDAASESQ